jgi:LPXTG-site transpeptidase (sortase) family protein
MKRLLLLPSRLPSWSVPVAIVGCFLIFLIWLGTTILPVTLVELRYQYRRALTSVFGSYQLRDIFMPEIHVDLTALNEHRQFGIVIPAIFLDEPVIFNVDPNDTKQYQTALRQGIAQASGTAFPGNGGIGYYFAHSSSPELHNQYNAVFYLLGKLKKDDDVYIWHLGEKFHYRVTQTKITRPDDVSFLFLRPTKETIVLQTCWPPGTTQQRLLVFAELVE